MNRKQNPLSLRPSATCSTGWVKVKTQLAGAAPPPNIGRSFSITRSSIRESAQVFVSFRSLLFLWLTGTMYDEIGCLFCFLVFFRLKFCWISRMDLEAQRCYEGFLLDGLLCLIRFWGGLGFDFDELVQLIFDFIASWMMEMYKFSVFVMVMRFDLVLDRL